MKLKLKPPPVVQVTETMNQSKVEATKPRGIKVCVLVLVIIGILIGAGVGIGLGVQKENNNLNEENDLEQKRETIRQLIADNVVTTNIGETNEVAVSNVNLGFLPNEAFALSNFSELEDTSLTLIVTFDNCSLSEVEENALIDPTISSSTETIFTFTNNQLEELPSNLFSRNVTRNLGIVNLSNNVFKNLSNSEELFGDTNIKTLILDENEFTELPLVQDLSVLSCRGCRNLELIQENYCPQVTDNIQGFELEIDDTPIGTTLTRTEIAEFTGCEEFNILGVEGVGRDRALVECQDMLEIEREFIRLEIASSIETTVFGSNDDTTILSLDTNIKCLPSEALNRFDFSEAIASGTITFRINAFELLEIEESVFASDNIASLPDGIKIGVELTTPRIQELPIGMFQPFEGKTIASIKYLGIVDLSTDFEQLFIGLEVERLELIDDGLDSLPVFQGLVGSSFTLVCEECEVLTRIESGYCSSVLPSGTVRLELEGTPIGNRLNAADIAFVTECLEEDVFGAIGQERDIRSCNDVEIDIEREFLRKVITENAVVSVQDGVFSVDLTNIEELRCLPNDAFRGINFNDLRTANELRMVLSDMSMREIEEDAFLDSSFFRFEGNIFIDLSQNVLTDIPDSAFRSFFLTANNGNDLSFVISLIFNGNRFVSLPPLTRISPLVTSLTISCENCDRLEQIDADYCSKVLPEGRVFLELDNTPIAQNLEASDIAAVTGCLEEDIDEEEGVFRALDTCEGVIEIERELRRVIVRDFSTVVIDGDEVSVKLPTNPIFSCLTNAVLSFLDFEVVDPARVSLKFSNLGIKEIEEDALDEEPWIGPIPGQEKRIVVDFSNNQLTALPRLLFLPILGTILELIDLSNNRLTQIDFRDAFEIFRFTGIESIKFDENKELTALPVIFPVPIIGNNKFSLSCINCTALEEIPFGFCPTVLPDGEVTLTLFNTLISQKVEKDIIELVTGCGGSNIIEEDEGVFRKLIGCNDIIEIERQAIRLLLDIAATGASVFSFSAIGDLGCLPNEAFQLIDFRGVASLSGFGLTLDNLGIVELESNAFKNNQILELPDDIEIDIQMTNNQISSLPPDLFNQFGRRKLSVNIGNNPFVRIPNLNDVVGEANLQFLDLSVSNLVELPLIENLTSLTNEFQVLCNGCQQLEFIEKDYCIKTLPQGEVTLFLVDNPIGDKMNSSVLSEITGCKEENIGESNAQRQLVNCEGILEIERQQIKRRLADNAQVSLAPGFLAITIDSVELPCLPQEAFSELGFDIPDLPNQLTVLVSFDSCRIGEIEEGAFGDTFEFLLEQDRVIVELNGNNLAALPSDLLRPFGRKVLSIDLSNNPLQTLPNAGEVFSNTGVGLIDFSETELFELPLPIDVNPLSNEIIIVCRGCTSLDDIEDGYCDKLIPNTVILNLQDSNVAVANVDINTLSALTGCAIDNILL